jgi:pimeloyl-ACP methyl ester carboxylesterase
MEHTLHTLDAQLAAFRATYQPSRAIFAGAPWSYYVAGESPDTLLLLPGAPGVAEMAFPYIMALSAHYRVIAPSYPASVGSLDRLLAGLEELIATEIGGPFHLIGASYSGLVAQYLLAHMPEHVQSLLIGDTGVPRPERGRAMSVASRVLARRQPVALHAAIFAALTAVLWGRSPAHCFWKRYFKGVVVNMTGAELANRVQVWVDMDCRNPACLEVRTWQGPTLLMETVHDPLFSPRERAALGARFAQAEVHAFHSRGHITALTRAPEYIEVMRSFLARHTQRVVGSAGQAA